MTSTIFIGNLPLGTSARSLAEAFQDFGTLVKCEIPSPKHNFSSIFGFVEFAEPFSAISAVEAMNSKEWNGNVLKIAMANSRHTNSSYTPPISRGGSKSHLPQQNSRYDSGRESSPDSRRHYGRPISPSYRPASPSYYPVSPNNNLPPTNRRRSPYVTDRREAYNDRYRSHGRPRSPRRHGSPSQRHRSRSRSPRRYHGSFHHRNSTKRPFDRSVSPRGRFNR